VLDSDEHVTAQADYTPATSTPEQSTSADAGAAAGAESVMLGDIGAPVSGGDPIEQPPVENGGSNGERTGSQSANGGTEGFGSTAGSAGGAPGSSPNPVEQPGSVSGPASGERGGGVPPAREPRGPQSNDRSES
jgi:hypothetical protein